MRQSGRSYRLNSVLPELETAVLGIFLICGSAVGQSSGPDFVFKNLTIEDGLSQSSVVNIIQDTLGYIWIGTSDGLNRYDGYTFTVYTNDATDTTSISDNGITALYEDDNGTLWVGTHNGILNKYDHRSDTFERYYITEQLDELPLRLEQFYEYPIRFSRYNKHSITAICEGNNGELWLGTWNAGVVRFDKETKAIDHIYNIPDDPYSISSNIITEIVKDHKDNIWIGTFSGGLNKIFRKETSPEHLGGLGFVQFLHYHHNPATPGSLAEENIISLYADSDNNLWAGTYNGGVCMLKNTEMSKSPEDAEFIHFNTGLKNNHKLSNNTVMTVREDFEKNILIGTFGGGLNIYNRKSGTMSLYRHDPLNENSLIDDYVISLHLDRSGIIWVGTHLGKGISKIERKTVKFNHISVRSGKSPGLNDPIVWSVLEDDRHNIWVGTYRGGLNKINRKTDEVTYYKPDPADIHSINDNHIRSIASDPEGFLWIGTYSSGLNKFNTKTGQFHAIKDRPGSKILGGNQIQSLMFEGDSVLWVGIFGGGLNKITFQDKARTKFAIRKYINDPDDSTTLSDNRVYYVYRDRNERLWVATFGGGLNLLNTDEETFTRFAADSKNETALADNRVMTIYDDSEDNLWVGTYGGGLHKKIPGSNKFIRYHENKGITTNVIYGMLEDNNKNLWMSSDDGLLKLDIMSDELVHYDIQDGVQSLEFSGGAYYKSPDGEMFFGGINGINYFFPDSIKDNDYIPPVVISSIKIVDEVYHYSTTSLELDYDQNYISFEFAALDYTNPEENYYAYKMEGIDDNWHYTDAKRRTINYSNLAPGSYTFVVNGTNNDGLWNPEPKRLMIKINGPFYKSWWFITLLALLITGTVAYFITIRIRNLLAVEKLKTKLAADLHDSIGSGLTEISIMSELISHDLTSTGSGNGSDSRLDTISQTARQLIDNMNDIVWMVNPKRDSLHDLIIHLKDSYSEFLSYVGISFKSSNLEQLKDIKIPMDYRQNLFMIFKESINNAIKHSGCSKIHLDAGVRGNYLRMTLSDNGSGIKEEEIKYGHGIKNIKRRASAIGGKLSWKSVPGKGTVINFTGKIKANKFFSLFREIISHN